MVKDITMGVVNTLHPQRGGGVTEMIGAIIALAVVAFVMYCNIIGVKLSPEMTLLFGLVTGWLGWIFKGNSKEDRS